MMKPTTLLYALRFLPLRLYINFHGYRISDKCRFLFAKGQVFCFCCLLIFCFGIVERFVWFFLWAQQNQNHTKKCKVLKIAYVSASTFLIVIMDQKKNSVVIYFFFLLHWFLFIVCSESMDLNRSFRCDSRN